MYELSSKEKKIEYFVNESISIILIFNLDDRSSFENMGNDIIHLKTFKLENDFYVLGSSAYNQQCTCEDEVNALLQACNFPAKYYEIFKYDQNSIKSFFNEVVKNSKESLKTKKKADKSNLNTSCNIY